jgi:segregation and condensation protein B
MSTKPEQHELVRSFAKSLKPPIRLSLPALETLAVIAYKQPVTIPEISEIRGVDSSGVIATLLDRKLITTSGRKDVIGRPILYKTTKEFLLRFGLKDVNELPSMEEFEKLVAQSFQSDLMPAETSQAETTTDSTKEESVEAEKSA